MTPNQNFNSPSPASENSPDLKTAALILVVILIVIAGALYWYWQNRQSEPAPSPAAVPLAELDAVVNDLDEISSLSSDLVTAVTPADPVSAIPDLNPAEAANPFTDIYQNPFAE